MVSKVRGGEIMGYGNPKTQKSLPQVARNALTAGEEIKKKERYVVAVLKNFRKQAPYNGYASNEYVMTILELEKLNPAQAVEYIKLLANGESLPVAESNDSNRDRAQELAAAE